MNNNKKNAVWQDQQEKNQMINHKSEVWEHKFVPAFLISDLLCHQPIYIITIITMLVMYIHHYHYFYCYYYCNIYQ